MVVRTKESYVLRNMKTSSLPSRGRKGIRLSQLWVKENPLFSVLRVGGRKVKVRTHLLFTPMQPISDLRTQYTHMCVYFAVQAQAGNVVV